MAAGFLLLLVLVDCVLTAFLFARYKSFRSEVQLMETNNKAMADALTAAAAALSGGSAAVPAIGPTAGVTDAELASGAREVLANATPEEIAQARAVLEGLGL